MVAATRLATTWTWTWIGILVSVLVGQALLSWLRFRWASGLARRSQRLARSLDQQPVDHLPDRRFEPAEPHPDQRRATVGGGDRR